MIDENATAEKSAAVMWAGDAASQALGMEIANVSAGFAVVSMPVRADMVNGLKTCHGGLIFALADSAFAFACNSYNQHAVAQHCSVTFIAPAKLGDVLIATAEEVSRAGRSGIYDVTVATDEGEMVAVFRGHSRSVKGQHFEDDQSSEDGNV